MEQQEAELQGRLPDFSGLSLHDVDELDDSVFASAIRELMDPDRRDNEAIAGFNAIKATINTDDHITDMPTVNRQGLLAYLPTS